VQYQTVDGKTKGDHIEWLQQSAVIPYKLVSIAIDQTTIEVFNAKRKGKRVRYTPYWDAILLYSWLQYTHTMHEEMDRLQENIMRCTTTYAMKAMHWGHKRTKNAIDILLTHNLIKKKRFTLRNEKGALVGSQQGIALVQ
jgi:hypothetical protein